MHTKDSSRKRGRPKMMRRSWSAFRTGLRGRPCPTHSTVSRLPQSRGRLQAACTRSPCRLRLFSSENKIDSISSADPHAGIVTPVHIEDYCSQRSTPESKQLHKVATISSERLAQSHMLSGHLSGQLLKMIIQMTQSRRILEIGTYTGYSLFAMLEEQARLPETTIPFEMVCVDPFTDEAESEAIFMSLLHEHPHKKHVRLLRTTGQSALQQLQKERADGSSPFDLVFVDADKESQIDYYETLIGSTELLAPHGTMVVDNTLWYGKVTLPRAKQDKTTRSIDQFNRHVNADPRTTNTLLPVRDGLTVIRRV